jgi:prevent-host-death family protein
MWHALLAMIEITAQQAAARIDELLDRAAAGEEVVMVRSGQPVARLVAYAAALRPRVPGRCAGQIVVVGDFNAPLPDDLLDAFEQ